MQLLYSLSIRTFYFLVFIASFFKKKAKLWFAGRQNLFQKISVSNVLQTKNVWFHVSSLGEFEQGRPVIEKFKQKYPNYKIVLTFFSPSGYEAIKNNQIADYIFYLPLDTKKNAKQFIKLIKPEFVFFVKYDFWYFFLKEVHAQKIPLYIFSTIFRKKQIFFRWYGGLYCKMLSFFTHIFVQNKESVELLRTINIQNVTIAGDTRFDRVIKIAEQSKTFPVIQEFKNNNQIFVAGSSWQPDEEIITKYINNCDLDIKFIIAPHDIKKNNVERICKSISKPVVKYSETKNKELHNYQVLIIDNIGMLSSIYKYGEIAYIGGGFGAGIHNTLESAVYGMPVIFGSKYQKFQEAKELIEIGAGFSINNKTDFNNLMNKFINENSYLTTTSRIARDYVYSKKGSSEKIIMAL